MKIKATKTIIDVVDGSSVILNAGDTGELPDEKAKRWIDAGHATMDAKAAAAAAKKAEADAKAAATGGSSTKIDDEGGAPA